MMYNILLFATNFSLSVFAIVPNILCPKYIKNDENLLQIGLGLSLYLFSTSIYGLFTGNFSFFVYGALAELAYLYITKPFNKNKFIKPINYYRRDYILM